MQAPLQTHSEEEDSPILAGKMIKNPLSGHWKSGLLVMVSQPSQTQIRAPTSRESEYKNGLRNRT